MYRIMLIEDDNGISTAITTQANSWGYDVYAVNDFSDIMSQFATYNPQLVLLDISLPFFDGYHWCGEIRKVSKVPIIFISSATDNLNIIMAMNMGADDFICKPFAQNVLMAKIGALLRRTYDFNESNLLLEHNGMILDTGNGEVSYNDKKLSLSKNEYKILFTLLRNKGKTVSREKLMEELWETDSFVDENTLSVNVNRLRKRLENIGLDNLIITKFGLGYIIDNLG